MPGIMKHVMTPVGNELGLIYIKGIWTINHVSPNDFYFFQFSVYVPDGCQLDVYN